MTWAGLSRRTSAEGSERLKELFPHWFTASAMLPVYLDHLGPPAATYNATSPGDILVWFRCLDDGPDPIFRFVPEEDRAKVREIGQEVLRQYLEGWFATCLERFGRKKVDRFLMDQMTADMAVEIRNRVAVDPGLPEDPVDAFAVALGIASPGPRFDFRLVVK